MALHEEEMGKEEALRRRRQRTKNLAVAFGLLALVVLFYLITIVKIGSTL